MKIIKNYEKATQELAESFVKRYYGECCIEDMYWVSNEIGSILVLNDEFWGVDRMIQALRLKATKKQVFDYYQYELDCGLKNEDKKTNFKNFVEYRFNLKQL